MWKGDGYFLLRDGLERIERRPRPVVNWNIEASDILVSREYELLIELVNLWSKETKGVEGLVSFSVILGAVWRSLLSVGLLGLGGVFIGSL